MNLLVLNTLLGVRLPSTIWINRRRGLHTHPPAILEHHSHSHTNATVTSNSLGHSHNTNTDFTKCSQTGAALHGHELTYGTANAHTHTNCVLSFGSGNLGSPNWWVHSHAITLVSMDNGGAAHSNHSLPSVTGENGETCPSCADLGTHTHVCNVTSLSSAGASHTHTIPATTTNAASSSYTPEVHTHTFSFLTNGGDSHSHNITFGADPIVAGNCARSKSHDHGHTNVVTNTMSHQHTLSGTSGSGGEAAPPSGNPNSVQIMAHRREPKLEPRRMPRCQPRNLNTPLFVRRF